MDFVNQQILFYDGECPFCNRAVAFVLKHKKAKAKVYFSALQSDFAKQKLGEKNISIKMDTLYLIKNQKVYDKSSAAILVCKNFKFPFNLLLTFYVVPKFLRDFVYTQIAKRRQKIGKSYCVVPKTSDQQFFI